MVAGIAGEQPDGLFLFALRSGLCAQSWFNRMHVRWFSHFALFLKEPTNTAQGTRKTARTRAKKFTTPDTDVWPRPIRQGTQKARPQCRCPTPKPPACTSRPRSVTGDRPSPEPTKPDSRYFTEKYLSLAEIFIFRYTHDGSLTASPSQGVLKYNTNQPKAVILGIMRKRPDHDPDSPEFQRLRMLCPAVTGRGCFVQACMPSWGDSACRRETPPLLRRPPRQTHAH